MRVGIISKYPPIEGGVSSEVYWLAKYLGKENVEVVIVTDSWAVEEEYRENIKFDELDKLQPKNVEVYQVNPMEINKKKQAGKGGNNETLLLSLGLEVDKKENSDIWYSHYLFPYGISAYFISKKTNKPLILRHAGSDEELLGHPEYLHLLDIIKDSTIISNSEDLKAISKEIIPIDTLTSCSLPKEFNSSKTYNKIPVIGVIGKEGSTKRWRELVEGLKKIDDEFRLFFLMNNKEKINSSLSHNLKKKTSFLEYVPPWRMPKIYKSIDILYCGEKGFYIKTHKPEIPLEGLYSGCCVCLSDELYEKYENPYNLEDGKEVVVLNTMDPKDIGEKISEVINKDKYIAIGNKGKKNYMERNNYEDYIKFMEGIFEKQIEN